MCFSSKVPWCTTTSPLDFWKNQCQSKRRTLRGKFSFWLKKWMRLHNNYSVRTNNLVCARGTTMSMACIFVWRAKSLLYRDAAVGNERNHVVLTSIAYANGRNPKIKTQSPTRNKPARRNKSYSRRYSSMLDRLIEDTSYPNPWFILTYIGPGISAKR